MTTKQLLFSALILGATANIALAVEEKTISKQLTPAVAVNYIYIQKDYSDTFDIHIDIEGVNEQVFKKLKEAGKEKDFIKCPCNIPGLPTEIPVYNATSHIMRENAFDPCEVLRLKLLSLSPEEYEDAVKYFSSKK